MHALKGLACRKRVAAASSPAATCKQGAAAPGLLAHASVTEIVKFCPMGPKLRYTAATDMQDSAEPMTRRAAHRGEMSSVAAMS